jgi:5,10-methylenetetrahydrofolate reductase
MSKAEDRVKTSIEIAADLIKGLKGLCQGVHIMPIGWEKRVPAVLDAAGL